MQGGGKTQDKEKARRKSHVASSGLLIEFIKGQLWYNAMQSYGPQARWLRDQHPAKGQRKQETWPSRLHTMVTMGTMHWGWPSASLFWRLAADWSRPATNKSISSERKGESLMFCWGEISYFTRTLVAYAGTALKPRCCLNSWSMCTLAESTDMCILHRASASQITLPPGMLNPQPCKQTDNKKPERPTATKKSNLSSHHGV